MANRQPGGQAYVSVDGFEYTLSDSGGVPCTVKDEEFSFSFIIGDNAVVVGGGAILGPDGWFPNPTVRVAEPDGEPGPISYFLPDPLSADVALDGSSVSITGEFQKQPANDGSNPPPVDVGTGVISFTCP